MTVKKTDTGNWLADIRPNGGSGKCYRKHFDTKPDAFNSGRVKFERRIRHHLFQMPDNGRNPSVPLLTVPEF